MAAASETGLFDVMEVDDDDSCLMLFAGEEHCLSIDLNENDFDRKNKRPKLDAVEHEIQAVHKKSRIEVIVRKRPLNSKEVESGEIDISAVYDKESRIRICEPRLKVDLTKYTQHHDFKFDHCFDENATNEDIYEICVKPLFNTILRTSRHSKLAGKATCFGYGQTGSGKTYTLLGSVNSQTGKSVPGLYSMAVRDLFKYLPSDNDIIVSFYEIYGGKLFDLLAERKPILCREDGKQKVNIIGLKRIKCDNVDFLMNIISEGNNMRQTGSTGANNASSRSHAILSMDILPIGGRLSFIDLAGSERGADTQNNDKQTRIEGAEINKSLLALKECIRALDQKAIHTPFRGSKLTQVLKESFIGNSRTLMIANISPNSGSCENTLNTLRYAYRVKELKKENDRNEMNIDSKPALSRNRSEPSLLPRKVHSRPGTANARKRGNNSNNNRSKEKKKNMKIASRSKASHHESNGNSDSVFKRTKLQNKERSSAVAPAASASASASASVAEKAIANVKPETGFKNSLSKKQLIKAHRKHIDEFMVLIKEDMQLLKGFDKDEFDDQAYHSQLKDVLKRQSNAVHAYMTNVFK